MRVPRPAAVAKGRTCRCGFAPSAQDQAALGSALSGATLIERRSWRDAAVLQHHHPAGRGDRLGPVRDDDARQPQLPDRLVHLPLALDVERARRLVEEQDLRPLVQRARQQDALLLPARQARAHVADERVVAHRHAPRSRRARRPRARTARPIRDRRAASKKTMLSVIEPANSWSSCITVPIMARQAGRPSRARLRPPTLISPACGAWMPSISLSRVVLPQPEGPTMATASPGSIARSSPSSTSGSPSA